MKYVLSYNAVRSLQNIKTYTEEHFGAKQTRNYLKDFQKQFEMLCQNPMLGIARDDIKKGYRCRFIGSHTIYYQIGKDRIEIIEVLHQSAEPLQILLAHLGLGKDKID